MALHCAFTPKQMLRISVYAIVMCVICVNLLSTRYYDVRRSIEHFEESEQDRILLACLNVRDYVKCLVEMSFRSSKDNDFSVKRNESKYSRDMIYNITKDEFLQFLRKNGHSNNYSYVVMSENYVKARNGDSLNVNFIIRSKSNLGYTISNDFIVPKTNENRSLDLTEVRNTSDNSFTGLQGGGDRRIPDTNTFDVKHVTSIDKQVDIEIVKEDLPNDTFSSVNDHENNITSLAHAQSDATNSFTKRHFTSKTPTHSNESTDNNHTSNSNHTNKQTNLDRDENFSSRHLSEDSILSAELRKRRPPTTSPYPFTARSLHDPPDCQALFAGNKAEQERIDLLQKLHPYHPLTPEDYMSLTTTNCTAFRSQFLSSTSVSDEERLFPLAFSIRLHKSVEQAARLLRAVYRPHNVYCLHVDAKSPSELRAAIEAIANCLPNVALASRTVNVVYSSFGHPEADMICMQDLLQSKVKWKYYLNLAGTEFPLKTNLELVRILKYLNGTNDVEQYYFPKTYHWRFQHVHAVKDDVLYDTYVHKPGFKYPGVNITYMKGCSYNSFSRAFVEWVLTADLPQAFINWARDTMAPDELIWATLNQYGPGGYPVQVAQTSKTFLSREVIWMYSAAYCYGQIVHAICILNQRNLPWLQRRWEFFANKFDLEVDWVAYQCLEQELLDRVHQPRDSKFVWEGVDRAPHVYFTRVLQRNITAARESFLL